MSKLKLVLVLVTLLIPISSAQSNWEIDDLSGQQLGNNSETTFVVNLSSKGTPLTPENLADTAFVRYRYNATDDSEPLQNLYSSYWVATESPSTTEGSFVEYEASGDADDTFNSGQEANTTTNYNIGNLTPVILTNTSERFRPDEEASFEAFVQNSSGDNVTTDIGVELNITDFRTGKERNKPLPRSAGTDQFEVDAKVFDGFNSSFYLEVFAENEAGEVGEASTIIQTLPSLDAELRSLESERCSSDSFPEDCQPNSTLTPFVSVTQGEANVVNATLLSGDDREVLSSQELQLDEQGNYTGTVDVPLVNTSQTTENMTLRMNVSNQEQSSVVRHRFNYSAFVLDDNTRSEFGSEPTVEKEVVRPITDDPVPLENLSGNFTVFNPSGQVVEEVSLADMEYTGQYEEVVDASEEGEYETVFEVEDQFGANRSLNSTFDYEPSSITFSIPLERDVDRNKTGQVPFSFDVENNRDETLELIFNASGELSENLSVNSGQNATVGPENQRDIGFNLSGPDLFEGESTIEISENLTDFSQELNLTVESECADSDSKAVRDNLCHDRPTVDATVDSDNFTEFDVRYVGNYSSTQSYQFNVTGNVSEIASLSNQSLTIGGEYGNDSATLNLSYNPQIPGFYSGNITSDTGDGDVIQSELSLTANVQNPSLEVGVPDSVDIGVIPTGGSEELDVEVVNIGDVPAEVVNASSETFDVSSSSETIGVNENRNITLSFSDVNSTSGSVTMTFSGGESLTERQLSASAETIPDYNQRVPELKETADDKELESSGANPELGEARTKLQNARSNYNEGNYERAKELFTQAKTTINEFEPSENTESDEDGDGTNSTDTEDTDPANTDPTETTNGSSGGGAGGLLLAGIVLLVLLVIGFVLATSIKLEPGDPLYGVFGE